MDAPQPSPVKDCQRPSSDPQPAPFIMEQSFSLISAQVQFMEDRLALVHIPLELYPYFLKPILQVLFHEVAPLEDEEDGCTADDGSLEDTATAIEQPAFMNISITPVECSVMCPRQLADRFFAPLVQSFESFAPSESLSITRDDFIAMQVYGEGLDAGQRVLELTSPLAMAGISIFFVSTYFSDYIVVPYRAKTQVIEALEKRGFQFETSTETFANNNHNPFNGCFSPVSSRSASSLSSPPSTPPPSTLEELQTRTFSSLRKNHIVPSVDRSLRLVQCAAHRPYTSDASSISILRDALTTSLVVDHPRFLSLTLTAADPAASLLLEQRLIPRFFSSNDCDEPNGESSLLLGSKEDILVPIMLDLRNLPLEATGIVCGVAGRLAEATHNTAIGIGDNEGENARIPSPSTSTATISPHSTTHSSSFDSFNIKAVFSSSAGSTASTSGNGTGNGNASGGPVKSPHALTPSTHRLQPDFDHSLDAAVEISFLSTARAGTILVGEHELHRAVHALEAESRESEDAAIQSNHGMIHDLEA